MNVFKKTAIAAGLAATAIVSTTPAMARDGYGSNDNTAAIAIGAGILGLAVGAIVASSDNDDDRYRNNRYNRPTGSNWSYRDDRGTYDRSIYQRDRRDPRDDYRRGYNRSPESQRRGF